MGILNLIKMNFKTAIYLGSNIDENSYENVLSRKDVILFASKIYPEAVPLKFKSTLKFFDEYIEEVTDQTFNYDVISEVSSDFNLSLLWTRFNHNFRNKYTTEISRFEFQVNLIHSSIKFIEDHNLKNVYFAYEPHNLPTYIFKKVCISLKINTATLKVSPFLTRLFAIDNLMNEIIVNRNHSNFALDKFIKSRVFSTAPISRNKSKLNKYPLNTSILFNYGFNRYLIKKSTPREFIFKTNFILFFLQVQPEMTTLPDGGIFVSQYEALKVLSNLCEKLNFKLVIREHPDTVKYFNYNWRNRSFIDEICSLGDHVFIDDNRKSNEEILKRCKGVGTITGTVISEALINGIPVITFGDHPFKGWNGKSLVQFDGNFNNLISSFKIATQLKKEEILNETESYLSLAYQISFGGGFLGKEKEQEIKYLWYNRHKAFIDFIDMVHEEN